MERFPGGTLDVQFEAEVDVVDGAYRPTGKKTCRINGITVPLAVGYAVCDYLKDVEQELARLRASAALGR